MLNWSDLKSAKHEGRTIIVEEGSPDYYFLYDSREGVAGALPKEFYPKIKVVKRKACLRGTRW